MALRFFSIKLTASPLWSRQWRDVGTQKARQVCTDLYQLSTNLTMKMNKWARITDIHFYLFKQIFMEFYEKSIEYAMIK